MIFENLDASIVNFFQFCVQRSPIQIWLWFRNTHITSTLYHVMQYPKIPQQDQNLLLLHNTRTTKYIHQNQHHVEIQYLHWGLGIKHVIFCYLAIPTQQSMYTKLPSCKNPIPSLAFRVQECNLLLFHNTRITKYIHQNKYHAKM